MTTWNIIILSAVLLAAASIIEHGLLEIARSIEQAGIWISKH